LLPVLELAFCFTILFIPTTIRFWHQPSIEFQSQKILHIYVNPDAIKRAAPPLPRFLPHTVLTGAARQSDAISTLNFPGAPVEGIVEGVIAATKHSPDSARPANLPLETWRALALPFYCLPAWWLVGRGFDALLKRRRLHWGFLLTGSILFLVLLLLAIGLYFSRPMILDANLWLMWGTRFWTILFAVLPAAWILQMIRQRRHRQPA
jgi:hypothetical protein